MLNRRHLLLTSIAAGTAMPDRSAFAKASQPTIAVKLDIPAGACDCHTHIHGDPEKFPFFAGRRSRPPQKKWRHFTRRCRSSASSS